MPSFRRHVGAAADVKALQYVSALHQTCMPLLRENGTVSSLDICRFLKSRTCLNVPHEQGIRIVRGLGGGVVGDDVIQSILKDIREPEEGEKKEKKRVVKKAPTKHERYKSEEDVEHMVHDQIFLSFEPSPEEQEVYMKEVGEVPEQDDEAVIDPDLEDANDDILGDALGEEYLDLVQLMAILLVPTLARAAKEWRDARIPEVYVEEPEPNYTGFRGWFRRLDDKRKLKIKEREDAIYESLHPKPESILQDTLDSMLKSVDRSSSGNMYPVMDAQLVRNLLRAHGEHERAADSVLVDKMVEAASSTTGLFDEKAFVTALTSDLSEWKVGSEDNETASMSDVRGFGTYQEKAIVESESKDKLEARDNRSTSSEETDLCENEGEHGDVSHIEKSSNSPGEDVRTKHLGEESKEVTGKDDYEWNRPQTWIDIDFSVDSHSSVTLTVVIFFFFMCTSFVYATLFQQISSLNPQCGDDFSCALVSTMITWMLFAVFLALSGYFVIIPLSIGNNPSERSPFRNFFAFILSLFFTWIPYVAIELYKEGVEPPYDAPEETVKQRNYTEAQWLTRIIGHIASFLLLVQFILAVIGPRRIRASKFMSYFFATSHVRGSARSKKAATRKINKMLENAHDLRPKSTSKHRGPALAEETMLNFTLRGERRQECGGLSWTWMRLLSGALFDEEGIWIASRLIIIQTAQFILLTFFTYSGFLLVDEVAKMAAQARADLEPGYPDWVYDFVPTSQQVKIALYPALGVSIFVMITLFLVYTPSYIRRIIEYRCGILPSLKSDEFVKYRIAVDEVYTNIGNAIFATIGSAYLFFFIVGLVIFLFIWPFSKDFMYLLMAWALGLIITVFFKQILVKYCRKRNYAGFYRVHPMGANLVTLALECWFIGLGGGVLVGRLISFILAACFFIGRTDVPFLSKEVALGGYAFDYVPTNFMKDLLVHEAHRHPYLERLLAMYLMKLKSDKFCSDAGACWRQLFVVALMPWFMKLRVFSDKRLEISLEAYNERRLERRSTILRSVETMELDDFVDDNQSPTAATPTTIEETDNSDKKKGSETKRVV